MTKRQLSILVDMNTDKLQLKLRAIAKHCEALADELDAIDNVFICPNCNGLDVCTMYAAGELAHASCNDCGYVIHDDSLPTRLEGSD